MPRRVNKEELLRRLLARAGGSGVLDSIAQRSGGLESAGGGAARLVEQARQGLEKLTRSEAPTRAEMGNLEAIVNGELRPVLSVNQGKVEIATHPLWTHLTTDEGIRTTIEGLLPSVGRIEVKNHPDRLPYVGTGFVVGDGLIMTNRHVAEEFARGIGSLARIRSGYQVVIDFLEEQEGGAQDEYGIDEVVLIHPYWDLALLRASSLPKTARPLALTTAAGNTGNDREVVVIGYPAFDARNNVEEQQRVFQGSYNVKRVQPGVLMDYRTVGSFGNLVRALAHDASTLGGNSGSAVFDARTGEVLGLHFAGSYLDANFAVPVAELVHDEELPLDQLHWAGERPAAESRIWVQSLGRTQGQQQQNQQKGKPTPALTGDAVIQQRPAPVGEPAELGAQPAQPSGQPATQPVVQADGSRVLTVDLGQQTTLRIEIAGAAPAPAPTAAVTEGPATVPDSDYSNRTGYDVDFLGTGDLRVPLPWLSQKQYQRTARVAGDGPGRHVLKYHHYSVVMDKESRFPFFTAVNIDGGRYWPLQRDQFRDHWVLDPRIPADQQQNNDMYRSANGNPNPLDRGHLVRRLDPCWGDTLEEVIAAHHDTFHYTNCAPQHAGFNRAGSLWLGIENYVLNALQAEERRGCVFSGPVLADDDPIYSAPAGEKVRLPRAFWKVVVVRLGERLSATAYLLSQAEKIAGMTESVFEQPNVHQVTVRALEERTGLSFRGLDVFDPFAAAREGQESLLPSRRRIGGLDGIVL